ncbi:GNAT family N-acetyltransferase [Micromonospora echinofusca]|uniref:GNAT family N-acetyltransferase n=1 Tax=Micromonospora echinofusca TaxID=47858 RepID=A0ABS3VYG5_MICEH|nr:GNAT family N-acetyltransferase [Micromonospora echinofusca]MBO4209565.1 GNAT family N-acetyltransferase [Micromonospora echinofusca]
MRPVVAEPVTTDRLVLLPLAVAHAAELAGVLADPELHTFIGGVPARPDELRSRYRRLVAGSPDPQVDWLNWALQLTGRDHLTDPVRTTGTDRPSGTDRPTGTDRPAGPGRLVGTVQATVSRAAPDAVAEIAWVVGTAWQRQGIATEAARGLVDWLRQQGVGRIVAHVHPDHRASASVATAAGLVPTDHRQDGEVRWVLPDGTRTG